MYAISFIILSYGLYVAVELVKRTQLLCETEHNKAIGPISIGDYNLFYFCTLGRVMLWYVLKWDAVG